MRKFLLIVSIFVISMFMSAWSNKVFADLITKIPQSSQIKPVSQKDLQVKEFIEACKQGNLEKVRALIKQGADVRGIKKTYGGKTDLQIAQQSGNEEIIKLLKAAGAKE